MVGRGSGEIEQKRKKGLMDMDNSVVIVGTGDMRVINGNRKIIIKTKKKDL